MRTIWKFLPLVSDVVDLSMPQAAEILSVQVQHGRMSLWAIVETDSAVVLRRIYVVGTGHPMPTYIRSDSYITTVQDGVFAWHFFDGGEVKS